MYNPNSPDNSNNLPEFESEAIAKWITTNTPNDPNAPGEYQPPPCFCLHCIEKRLEKTIWQIWDNKE